nr:hypothetical protein CFP56_72761 [Quercus suber]
MNKLTPRAFAYFPSSSNYSNDLCGKVEVRRQEEEDKRLQKEKKTSPRGQHNTLKLSSSFVQQFGLIYRRPQY